MVTSAFNSPPEDDSPRNSECPRCQASLIITYHEPECLQCGYVYYSYTPPTTIIKTKSLMSSTTRFVFRYIGDSPHLMETLIHAHLERIRNRIVYAVTCPFCQAEMEQSSLSGKRREIREERYKCPDGHRISLIPNKQHIMGWRV